MNLNAVLAVSLLSLWKTVPPVPLCHKYCIAYFSSLLKPIHHNKSWYSDHCDIAHLVRHGSAMWSLHFLHIFLFFVQDRSCSLPSAWKPLHLKHEEAVNAFYSNDYSHLFGFTLTAETKLTLILCKLALKHTMQSSYITASAKLSTAEDCQIYYIFQRNI